MITAMNRVAPGRLLAAMLLVAGLPAFANGSSCNFQAQGLSMGFGLLDPSNAVSKTVPVAAATLSADTWGACISGNTMTLSGSNGQNFSGGKRNMRNAAGDLIAYDLISLPQSRSGPGNNTYVTFTFSGTVAGTAYQNASAGLYSDIVIISVTP